MNKETRPTVVSDKDWQDLIGIQFALSGQDRRIGLNCYGLVREVYKGLQIELPAEQLSELNAEKLDEKAGMDWTPIETPVPYAVALIRSTQGDDLYHLAIVTPELTLLHALPKKGVVVSPIERYRERLVGFYRYTPGQGQRLPVTNGDVGRIIGAVLITVVAVVATVLTYGAAGGAAAGWTAAAWGALAGAAVSMAGNMIMNAVAPIKPDLPQLSGWGGDLADSRSYTWDGIVNDARQGLVKAMVFGRIKVGGQIISEKTWFDGANNEYLDTLLCPAVGRITRFSGIQINDTGIELYQNTAAVFRPGDDEQRPIDMFNRIYLQYTSAAKIPYDASDTDPVDVIQFSTKQALTGIRLTITAPNGIYEMPSNSPIPHDVTFRVQYRPQGGAWADLPTVDPYYSGQTPFINRTSGAFSGSANPFTLADANAKFDKAVTAGANFELEIGSTTYYCTQIGTVTGDSIQFNAFTDEGRTAALTAAPANGAYVLKGPQVKLCTAAVPVEYPDPPSSGG